MKLVTILLCSATTFVTSELCVKSHHRLPRKNTNLTKGEEKSYCVQNQQHDRIFQNLVSSPLSLPRGGASAHSTLMDVSKELLADMKGMKSDILLLLFTTALNTPICEKLSFSPILGLLSLGLLLGPNGKGYIKNVHTTEIMADVGILLFLFEMGIHLDIKTLLSMKKEVFGVGLSQFSITALIIMGICKIGGLSVPAMIVIGWSLALSSSAFVLQLLKDREEMGSQYGKSSFGTLLLQDLMVVPLLVMTPILAGNGVDPMEAVANAIIRIIMAFSIILAFGKTIMNPIFDVVSESGSKESFIALILGTVLLMSFLTEGLGLSNTLGAFLTGVMIAETKHRHHVEKEASPFRGILVGLFFFTVGFEIDLKVIISNPTFIASLVFAILALKATIAIAVGLMFGLPLSTAQRFGLVLSQGGEFAFVAFRVARSVGILNEETTKILLTSVGLTMALTPILESVGTQVSRKLTA